MPDENEPGDHNRKCDRGQPEVRQLFVPAVQAVLHRRSGLEPGGILGVRLGASVTAVVSVGLVNRVKAGKDGAYGRARSRSTSSESPAAPRWLHLPLAPSPAPLPHRIVRAPLVISCLLADSCGSLIPR